MKYRALIIFMIMVLGVVNTATAMSHKPSTIDELLDIIDLTKPLNIQNMDTLNVYYEGRPFNIEGVERYKDLLFELFPPYPYEWNARLVCAYHHPSFSIKKQSLPSKRFFLAAYKFHGAYIVCLYSIPGSEDDKDLKVEGSFEIDTHRKLAALAIDGQGLVAFALHQPSDEYRGGPQHTKICFYDFRTGKFLRESLYVEYYKITALCFQTINVMGIQKKNLILSTNEFDGRCEILSFDMSNLERTDTFESGHSCDDDDEGIYNGETLGFLEIPKHSSLIELRCEEDGSLYARSEDHIYRSIDGAQSWSSCALGEQSATLRDFGGRFFIEYDREHTFHQGFFGATVSSQGVWRIRDVKHSQQYPPYLYFVVLKASLMQEQLRNHLGTFLQYSQSDIQENGLFIHPSYKPLFDQVPCLGTLKGFVDFMMLQSEG